MFLTKKEKILYIFGPVVYSFVSGATNPTVRVWFASVIDPTIVAIANLIELLLAAAVNWSFTREQIQELYRRLLKWIIIMDCTLYIMISITGLSYPELRYLGFALTNAVSTCIWFMILRNAVDRILTDGDQRTAFEGFERTANLIAGFCGGLIAIAISSRDIEVVQYCIYAECIANTIMGAADWYIFKKLNKKYEGRQSDGNCCC